jgi:hypothetical protein
MMRAVVPTNLGVLELNYMWLPTFIGMNSVLKRDMEKELAEGLKGKSMNEKTLDEAHKAVCSFLMRRFPTISGLDRLLDSLKYIELKDEGRSATSQVR